MITVRYQGPSKGSARLEALLRTRGVPVSTREVRDSAAAVAGRVDFDAEVFVEVELQIALPADLNLNQAISLLESIAADFKRTVGFPTRVEVSPSPL